LIPSGLHQSYTHDIKVGCNLGVPEYCGFTLAKSISYGIQPNLVGLKKRGHWFFFEVRALHAADLLESQFQIVFDLQYLRIMLELTSEIIIRIVVEDVAASAYDNI
jgi:hypothetical protein